MKRCTKCGEEKPLEAFNNDKSRKDGKHPWCKPCARSRRNAWYEKNREANLAYQAQWRAENPGTKKASDARWREENRDAHSAQQKEYRSAKREQRSAYQRERHQRLKGDLEYKMKRASERAKRRARLAGARHEPYSRKAIYERDGGKCRHCQQPLPYSGGSFHIDHIVPIALGGDDIPANVQLLCPPCNQRKSATLEGQIHLPV